MERLLAGIDIGGTNLKAGLFGPSLEPLLFDSFPVRPDDRQESGMVERVAGAARELLARHGSGRLAGIGVGAAGVIDTGEGVITQSPHFPAWRDYALRSRLSARCGCPVALENDVNAIAIGEHLRGAAAGIGDFVCIALGTGLGGALFLGGQVWRGVGGMAGEIGHLNVEPEGPVCNCGSRGCLETFASASGLRREAVARGLFPADAPDIPERLAERCRAGDPAARESFDRMARYLGIAMGGLLNVLNVKTILVCGGIAGSLDLFGPGMRAELVRRSFPAVSDGVEIVRGTLGSRAGVVGAAGTFLSERDGAGR